MKTVSILIITILCLCLPAIVLAQVPGIINYQGRVTTGGTNFTGAGQFKFALVNNTGATTYWSNDGSSVGGSQPTAAVSLTVTKGLYSVLLGDTTILNMTVAIGPAVFTNTIVRLRVWFNDGVSGFQQLSPDQRLAAAGYALAVANVRVIGNNTFVGQLVGINNTSGGYNTAVGSDAFFANTSGSFNTAIGDEALDANTTGSENTASGYLALQVNTSGGSNTASGAQALRNNTTGYANTANGHSALNRNTTGVNNTAMGVGALYNNTNGVDNTAIGVGALYNNTNGVKNTAIGVQALRYTTSSENTAVGWQAMFWNTTGSNNTAFGLQALAANTTGNQNTASGAYALRWNTTGSGNTANGHLALYSNTTGQGNTAAGKNALINNTSGINNTAVGRDALATNTVGSWNTAIGEEALFLNVGSANTAVGQAACGINTNGWANTAVGLGALNSNTSGSTNIALGYMAGANLTTGSYNIDIGNRGVAGESATIRIGTNTVHTATYIAGISGATASGGLAVYVNASGKLGTTTSSRRFKEAIQDMAGKSDVLLSLHPVSFRYKPEIDPQGIPQFGLVAEEVEKVAPALVVRDAKGEVYSVRYEQVNAMLLNEFLKEHQRVQDLEKRLAQMEKQMQTVSHELHAMQAAPQSAANVRSNGGM